VGGGVLFTDARFADSSCASSPFVHDGFVVVQPTAGNFLALSTSCTHACCQISLDSSTSPKTFVCPCHGSRFSLAGSVLQGPAMVPLRSLTVCTDECNVYVEL
jgi:Rieske Fe-S protein